MSISMRSTKQAMYSEIERLRALIDVTEQRITLLEETNARLTAKSPPAPVTPSDRRHRLIVMKRLAITLRTQVKYVEGEGFKALYHGGWDVVPKHTLEFVLNHSEL